MAVLTTEHKNQNDIGNGQNSQLVAEKPTAGLPDIPYRTFELVPPSPVSSSSSFSDIVYNEGLISIIQNIRIIATRL